MDTIGKVLISVLTALTVVCVCLLLVGCDMENPFGDSGTNIYQICGDDNNLDNQDNDAADVDGDSNDGTVVSDEEGTTSGG